jgi:tetratricopeptide (TPR) repeat protein
MFLICGGLFVILAGVWAAYDPIESSLEVARLGEPGRDHARIEAALLRRGRGSLWALRNGVQSPEIPKRLRCARLLALLGDDDNDKILLDTLSQSASDEDAALAETLLLSVWDHRRGPQPEDASDALRDPAPAGPGKPGDWKRSRTQLDMLLSQYPAWSSGYVARAKLRLANREVRAAIEDATSALYWEPKHFEAIKILAECYLLLDYPEQAQDLYEQALEIDPRLRASVQDPYDRAREEAAAERQRRLIERHKELPVL